MLSNWCIYFNNKRNSRSEPQCITCDLGEVLWSSRYYYSNCSYFNAYVSPEMSSMSTETGINYYILECLGPGLPLAGEFSKT